MTKRGIYKLENSLVYFDKLVHLAFEIKKILFRGKSNFQKIDVVEFNSLGKSLILDNEIQIAEADEKIYHSAFVDPILRNKTAKNILILGGGDGGVAREILKYPFVKTIKIIDIDGMVTEVVKKYFKNLRKVFSNPKVELINQDAFEFIRNCNERFDVIFSDLTDTKSKGEGGVRVNRLYLLNTVKKLKKLLKKDGILIYQSSGYYFFQNVERMKKMFEKLFKHSTIHGTFALSFFDLWCFVAGSDEKFNLALDKESKIFNVFEIKERPLDLNLS